MVLIWVQRLTGTFLDYDIALNGPVRDLKDAIYEREGKRSAEYQTLTFSGKQLEDDSSFLSYGISENDFLLLSFNKTTDLFMRSLTGKTIICNVDLEEPVIMLKNVIEEKEGIPSDQQRIVFGGEDLYEYATLESYGVQEEATLHLVLRLRGGWRPPVIGYAVVIFNWNGVTRHPKFVGLALSHGEIVEIYSTAHTDWCYGALRGFDGVQGYFPRNYVKVIQAFDPILMEASPADTKGPRSSPSAVTLPSRPRTPQPTSWFGFITAALASIKINTGHGHSTNRQSNQNPPTSIQSPATSIQNPATPIDEVAGLAQKAIAEAQENGSAGESPALPRLPISPPSSVRRVTIPLGNKGASYFEVKLQTGGWKDGRAIINITLTFSHIPPKRISSASLRLNFPPGSDVGVADIYPKSHVGPPAETNLELNRTTAIAGNFQVGQGGNSIGGSINHEVNKKQTATRYTHLEINGSDLEDGARWLLTENSGMGASDGLPYEVSLSLSLSYLPQYVNWKAGVYVNVSREHTARGRMEFY